MRSVQRRQPVPGVVRAGTWSARVSAHPGARGAALLVPLAARPPTHAELSRVLTEVATFGFEHVVVQVANADDEALLVSSGFTVVDRLDLLHHDLERLPPVPGITLRRPHRGEQDTLVAIDHAAFDPFWRLDHTGLDEARRATPSSRLRVGLLGASPAGFAVTGRAGAHGYIQRLAVRPGYWGRGVGSALLLDGLHWARARGAQQAVVNTQVGNDRARSLYLRHGFRLAPTGIAVLTRPLGDVS